MPFFSVQANNNKFPTFGGLPINKFNIFVLFLFVTRLGVSASSCYEIHQKNNYSSYCLVCPQKETCTDTNKQNVDYSLCQTKCCNPNIFLNTLVYQICQSSSLADMTSSNVSIASIFMIVFFAIPALICFIVCIVSCCRKYRGRRSNEQEPTIPVSAVDLAAFNIDDLGPFYQDRDQTCSICLQNSCNIRTKCGHCFHSYCLKTWVNKKQSCPFCVSKQINPILLYCTTCWKQSKLVLLREYMHPHEQLEWTSNESHKCQRCVNDNNQDVSIHIEISEEGIQKNQPQASNVKNQPKSIHSIQ